MSQKKASNFFQKNTWIIGLLLFSVAGIILGIMGFRGRYTFPDNLYETFRLFTLNPSSDDIGNSCMLQWAKWLIFAAFILATFRLFFEIIAPQYFKNLIIKLFYRKHIIICGMNEITSSLIKKFGDQKIIIISEETNKYAETLKAKGKKLLIGDFSNENLWKKAKLKNASQLFSVVDSDEVNLQIAQSVFSYSERKRKKVNALKCFVLIKDRELKTIMEETVLFKYKTDTFDGSIFNINEMGIKYGIAMNIDKILPASLETAPNILLVGLTEKTAIVLFNMAHCLTISREKFNFTIVEKDTDAIHIFKMRYTYLFNNDFATINFVDEIDYEKKYDSIIVCSDNETHAIKQAVSIRYSLAAANPNIIVFCNTADIFSELMEKEDCAQNGSNTLKNRNILLINLFEEVANYVFDLESEEGKKLEKHAKEAHHFWNHIYKKNEEWDTMSGHFKQSNRNQILDNYIRAYIVLHEKFENITNDSVSLSDEDKETLARMEHLRWMIEKFENGWVFGERNNEFKQHNCLVQWDKLTKEEQEKDKDAINLMIELLNNQSK